MISVLQLELVGQIPKRIPSRIGRDLIAGAFRLIQILTTARAKSLAVRRTESAARQGKQHLLTHHILQQKTALFIITDFGLICCNRALAEVRIGCFRPENEVKVPCQRYRHRFNAPRALNLEVGTVMRPQPDIVDMRARASMLDQQIGDAVDRQRTYLPDIRGIVQRTRSNDLIELKRLINELDRSNQHRINVSRFPQQIKWPGKRVSALQGVSSYNENSSHLNRPDRTSNVHMNEKWKAAEIPSLAGKRILITGANSGIGYHAALKLARKGAQVMLACRDRKRGEAALASLGSDAPSAHTELVLLDLASLASVRSFAEQELAKQRPLHILINNAGVMAPPKRLETADGFELQFGTNVLGHFALTGLLMPALERAAIESPDRPRVITIASIAHKQGHLKFDDLQSRKDYRPMRAYQQSKLADLMFALELDRRLRTAGSRVMSVAAHPGVARTNLFEVGDYSPFEKVIRSLVGHVIGIVLNTDAEGALPTLYAATASGVQDGGYYGPQGFQEMRGDDVGSARIAPQALDTAAAARLWQVCEDLTGIRFL